MVQGYRISDCHSPRQRPGQYRRHVVRRRFHWLSRQVSIAGGGLYLGVAKQLADHVESLAGGDRGRRECVAQVVDPDVLEAGTGPHALPKGFQVGEPGAVERASNHPWVFLDALDLFQHVDDWA